MTRARNRGRLLASSGLSLDRHPRVEYLAEYLARTQGKKLGIVTTSDVFDATAASMAFHTQARGAGTAIVDQFFDDRRPTGLTVLMGGGRKWFLPNPTNCPAPGCGTAVGFNGSARGNSTDYTLPSDIIAAWGAAPGVLAVEHEYRARQARQAPRRLARHGRGLAEKTGGRMRSRCATASSRATDSRR